MLDLDNHTVIAVMIWKWGIHHFHPMFALFRKAGDILIQVKTTTKKPDIQSQWIY